MIKVLTELQPLVAGSRTVSPFPLEVHSPYTGEVVGRTFLATPEQIEDAVAGAVRSFEVTRRLASHERASILNTLARKIEEHGEELSRLIALEAGKPIKDARAEVSRGLIIVTAGAEEAKRVPGEVLPLDLAKGAEGRWGIVRRFPIGPVLGITPFNFPLNLAMHKVVPAIASGNPIVLKLPSKTPLTMLRAADFILEAGWPPEALSLFATAPDLYDRLVMDDRFKMISFTGSAAVGWRIKAKAGKKRIVLELGGNAGVIVDADAPLERTVKRIVAGGFSFAGQSCISVQRVYVHETIASPLTEALLAEIGKLKLGDPLDPETDLGPMIDPQAVERTHAWIQEAVREGARVLCGGSARGAIFEPTLLTDVKTTAKVCREEVFAPLIVLFPFKDLTEAIAAVNDSPYGLQAGIFTNNLANALRVFESLEVGGIILNDIPSWRMDTMPYGGVKDSGFGREGIRYAIEEMTEMRLLVICP